MANVLHKFEQKTKILASQVNENFEFLQDDIGILSESIDSKLSSTKQDILSDVQTVKNSLEEGKANSNLSNIDNLDKTGIEKILNYIKPDMSSTAAINISSGFTATADGWVEIYTRAYSNRGFSIKINGKVFVSLNTDAGLNGASWQGFIWKGDKVEFSGESMTSYFRPMISTFK